MLVDKPAGPTSHDVVTGVRRALGIRSAGHTGTLDPFATGLMIVLLGRATRLARYVRGRRGVIDRLHGAFDLPELAAVGEHRPEHVYEVRFDAAELWGESAEPNTCVYAQLWESYLLPE